MSYDSREASVDDGRPFNLVQFARGSSFNRFTTLEDNQTAFGETFFGSSIGIGEITTGGRVQRDTLAITFDPKDSFAQSQIGVRGPQQTTVTVWRNHVGEPDTEARVIFKGRVIGAKPGTSRIEVTCSSIFSQLRDPGLNRRYGRACDWVLYQVGCGLNRADFEDALTCTASDGITHTVTGADAQADDYYTGGIIDFGGALGFIVSHTGTEVVTRAEVVGLADAVAGGSQAVNLAPGCDRRRSTCETKFSNIENYGGFPFIPETNPFGGKSEF